MYSRILVATDGSELAEKGVDHAVALAKALNADLTVITATEPTLMIGTGAGMAWTSSAEVMDELIKANKDQANAILASARRKAEAAGIACKTIYVPDSYAGDAILDTAEAQGQNLIVMASHGRRGLGRLVMGSQASDVLSRSKIPVLIVK
ncbi:Nucleotide-binding universal stress protein, UspA family [Devosia enhydra]|uniref:Nucleotide-binding universal stress protein, UspA family n=1 Tax=Devosia enhydra TaxID=665118 RepID=A0A1K2I2M3_9HYPH|nr:universal stress protein [Devosia enhydra]SFZ86585.1 Nucleotide-binding universal stress protein, UspA family [Devosia enhydra]